MAEMTFGAKGKRWSALARLIAESDPSIQVVETEETITLRGQCITVTKQMVEKALFPKGVKNPKTAERVLYGLVLTRKGRLIAHTDDRIVIGDDDGERAMTVRLRTDHQQDITRLADELNISRNQFVVRAIEHFVRFLEESRTQPTLDEQEDNEA
ncbi:MAG TPA: hypothetical protein GXZ82_09350 [Firmicutes bacterium]|jgi:hypothetical protein|nr:hypothetical protein [Bacillota bacterium]